MAANKGKRKPQYSDNEKSDIVERICQLYESQQATLESCCEAAGIDDSTFRLWRSQNSEFSERFKKAKQNQDDNYWQDIIRPLTKRAIQKHLEVEFEQEYKEVVWQGVKAKDELGNPVIQVVTKFALPNPTVTIFAAKGLYPETFKDRHEHTGTIETKTLIIEIPPENGDGE